MKNSLKFNLDLEFLNSYIHYVENLVKNYSCFFPSNEKLKINFDEEFFQKEMVNLNQMILEITQKCNFRCRYCAFLGNYLYSRVHMDKSMAYEIARKSIDFFSSLVHSSNYINRPVSISFYGGEPFLEFALIVKCIDYIYDVFDKSEVSILITTNGSLLTHKIIDFLIDKDIHLNISLDGPACEHDKNRVFPNGKGIFNVVWRNIQTLYREYYDYYIDKVGIQITYAPNHDIFNIKKFFEENSFLINSLLTVNPIYQDDLAVKYQVYVENTKKVQSLFHMYKENIIKKTPDPFMNICFRREFSDFKKMHYRPLKRFVKYTSSCSPGCQKLFVSADGQFHACEKINR